MRGFTIYHVCVFRFNLERDQMQEVFNNVNSLLNPWSGTFHPDQILDAPNIDQCPFPTKAEQMSTCNPGQRYRTIDGSCNNLENPLWGKSFRPMGRFLPAEYGDSKYTVSENIYSK